nr:hypothetical protein [Candidatus Cloacimonadota bacterium]
MKKQWIVILALMLITSLFATRYEVVAYHEDFESGADGWVHYDGFESPNEWSIYNFGGTQGNVWWMGDTSLASGTNIGGYHNHQYLVLDTPEQAITAGNSTLTFKMRLGLEDPAGATDPYSGWDSANIRISIDGGNTWNVITGNPVYDFDSSYAFGYEHGEGPGVPAWGGIVTDWTTATFDLSSYIGETAMIRFAFASDPAYSTIDQPDMFGFMVDDISFAGYTNNGVDDGQMVSSSLVPLGGDLWHIATEPTAPSPTHVMKNQNDNGTYNDNMLNYLVSPPITLPSSGDIRCDFQIMGDFSDPGTFPEIDYFGWEISIDDGLTWFAMSNPYGDPEGTNYVYPDAPTVWASMVESYSLSGDISDYAGETVKFRWYFQSNSTPAVGTGIMIDDFVILNDVFIAPPENLVATVDGTTVNLEWSEPGSTPPPPSDLGDDFESYNDFALQFGDWTLFDGDLSPTYGFQAITFPNSGSAMAYLIFNPSATTPPTEGAATHSGQKMAASFAAVTPPNNDWMITPQFTAQPGDNFTFWGKSFVADYGLERFKVGVSTTGTNPADFTIISGANYVSAPVAWTQFSYSLDSYAGQDIYVGIQCVSNDAFIFFVDDVAIQGDVKFVNQSPQVQELPLNTITRALNPVTPGPVEGIPSATRDHRNVSGYRIYRDDIMIDEVASTVTQYTDMNVEGGIHSYYVTAMYDANESLASNTETVFIIPDMHSETFFDDGTAEEGFTAGPSNRMAVLHNWHNEPVTLKWAKVYVEQPTGASLVLQVYEVDPETNLPGNQLLQIQYPGSNIVHGWNYIPFTNPIVIESGKFFLGILEPPNAVSIGLDTDSSGHSYTNIANSGWTPKEDGELMVRAIVYTGTGIGDGVTPALKLSATNYPNPFNPTTTISFTVPENGMTKVRIFNLKGQLINTLVNSELAAGNHTINWNGTDASGQAVSSGVYFLRVDNNNKSTMRKMLLSK